ncbi:MAG: hypothetical protein F9K48_05455 [Candidatus Brocadia sp.]|nr:MAG: hypothetical protein F9K48_05455 [Candidatus Brocadia sp.]
MTLQTITLQIPEHIYERAQQVAETTDQPLEAVFLHELENAFLPPLPEDEEAELSALSYLSDDALWTIAREQMPSLRQERMQVLMDGNTKGTLLEVEYQELEHLVEQGQRLMLRKGKAAALLTERDYKITRESLRG